jgi:hypothetical protein
MCRIVSDTALSKHEVAEGSPTFGKTLWPPHGDMSKPNESGRVRQSAGNQYVAAGSMREPGVVVLSSPSTMTMMTTAGKASAVGSLRIGNHALLRHARIPIILVKLNSLKGKKFRGISNRAQTTFHSVTDMAAGKRRLSESANSTIRATQAANSSSVKRMLVASLARGPNETKARSEKVMMAASSSMHLAKSLAVYAVMAADRNRVIEPQIQPAYLMPMGRLSRPTPMRTLARGLRVSLKAGT